MAFRSAEHTQEKGLVKVRIAPSKLRLFGWFLAGTGLLSGCVAREGTIGAMLGQRGDGRLFVREAPPTLAASRYGLLPGDEILLIDGRDVRGLNAHDLHLALAGEEGTKVKITAIRGDSVLRRTLTRGAAPHGGQAAK
jgi:C-terminal processing protease CtpA/Prc